MKDSETDSNSLRHIDGLLGSRPGFVTPPVLPNGTWLQFYSVDIEVSGGDTPPGTHLQPEVIGSLLSQGLTVAPVPDQPTRLRIRGIPTEGGPNYLYVRVVDGDGDPAWRIFSFQIAVGPGLLLQNTEIIKFVLAVVADNDFAGAWRKFGGLLPGRIRKRNLPYTTASRGSWTSVLLLGRMIRSSSAFTCA